MPLNAVVKTFVFAESVLHGIPAVLRTAAPISLAL
jgi:hypothetical protein